MKDNRIAILGAVCGDIIGSSYEFRHTKRLDFKLLPVDARLHLKAMSVFTSSGHYRDYRPLC